MIDSHQFRCMVENVLHFLHPHIPYSDKARELLMLTAAAESCLGKYFWQVRGPARGVFQIEPATERWMLQTLGNSPSDVGLKIKALGLGNTKFPDMIYSLPYQIAMARYFYWLKPGAIPADLRGMAEYYKKYFNTYLGKATVEGALAAYHDYCEVKV